MDYMAQINIYVPPTLERKIRREARLRKKSLSAYVAGLLREAVDRKRWKEDFFTRVIGRWKGDFPSLGRDLPEEREHL